MALYKIDFKSVNADDDSNQFVNTFFFVGNDILPSSVAALNLADWFKDNFVEAVGGWKDIVGVLMDSDSIVVTSPFNPTVLGIALTAVAGTRTGNQMPRFVSWGFKSERTRADIRAGFKRFGIISETDTSGDVPTVGMVTVLNTFANLMSTIFAVEGDLGSVTMIPAIVKRIPVVVGGETVGYRLPENDLELEYSQATNWVFQQITTQNTRKR